MESCEVTDQINTKNSSTDDIKSQVDSKQEPNTNNLECNQETGKENFKSTETLSKVKYNNVESFNIEKEQNMVNVQHDGVVQVKCEEFNHEEGIDKSTKSIINYDVSNDKKGVISARVSSHGTVFKYQSDAIEYDCKLCDYSTTTESYLNNHSYYHHAVKSYNCTACTKRYIQKRYLDRHILYRHSENKNLLATITSKIYECQNCTFKATTPSHLKLHIKSRHKELKIDLNKYTHDKYFYSHFCTICNIRFHEKKQIDSHIFSYHSDDKNLMATITNTIHECPKCSYKCLYVENVNQHINKKHKIP